jgi:hypothetical protein
MSGPLPQATSTAPDQQATATWTNASMINPALVRALHHPGPASRPGKPGCDYAVSSLKTYKAEFYPGF